MRNSHLSTARTISGRYTVRKLKYLLIRTLCMMQSRLEIASSGTCFGAGQEPFECHKNWANHCECCCCCCCCRCGATCALFGIMQLRRCQSDLCQSSWSNASMLERLLRAARHVAFEQPCPRSMPQQLRFALWNARCGL